MAELWAIREALIQAWNKGHRYVYLQTDSLLATNWLKDNNTDCPLEFTKLILDCRWLLARPWSWTVDIGHVWREANQCADRLAKRGASQNEREILYDTCPTFLLQCLHWDSMSFVSSRVVSASV